MATHVQEEGHHPSASGYAKVAIVLFVLTIFEVAVYYIEPLRVLDLLAPIILVLMALFGELLEPGKPIISISTELTRFQASAKPQAEAGAPSGGLQPRIDPKSIGNVELGREFWILRGCSGCHLAPGIPGGGQIGPNQAHFADRPTIAGGVLPNRPESVERWLKDPPAVKPGTLMPNLSLTEDQIKDLTAFLYSLP
jgi:cytochrome c oxidase subunit 2